ncbi:relaxase/mobilization nuclease domain-containing protein [Roseibium polysiphoniae]|uniref:MobA/VirD2-like nuclease domain-containing protein n=1 Tax=Roseibium polysiphoniae TaxID=2571221 RepID=A0ABR9CF31_9HYPH|nr:hypothetical protein [Roseibium polysiphoniae]MBD8877670.1 hypothetical protein [Roseibium polysiphoniae]
MIAGVGRHARTRRDSRALVTHLLKPENNPRVRILGGTLASDLPDAVRDMERLRDASKADAAALHIFLSPSLAMSDNELARAAEIVIGHFGAEGHPAALVFHDKERRDGDGHRHAHLVLGRVSPEGRVLESGYEKIKIETASRIVEHELGEPATLGRHHASAVHWLRNNRREDVASWLEAIHGPDPERPTSAASPDKRQALARQGVNFSDARAAIRDAWTSGGAEAVRSAGYEIAPGRKSGVYIVSAGNVEIGALDRLTGEKRADVRLVMEADLDRISRKESKSENTQRPGKPAESVSQPSTADPSSEKSASFRPVRSGTGTRPPLYGRKKSGAEQVSEASAEQARQFAEGHNVRLDDRLAVAAARRWIEGRRATLKGAILESSQALSDADARREVAQCRRGLAVLDAADTALRADPGLAYGGEKALMGAARRLHAERTAATRDEIRTAWESGGVAALRNAGYEIAPDRDGTWRVLRNGVPLGTLDRLTGEKPPDARQRSALAPDAEKPTKSRKGRTSWNPQRPEKPVQRDSRVATGDPSSGKQPRRRTPEEAFAAANSFLDRLDANLSGRIAELFCPDRLPEPAELTDARRRLAGAAQELAAWDAHNGTRVTELRLRTASGRPRSFWAWAFGATGRYDVASRELAALSAERERFLIPVTAVRREINILRTAQEVRQSGHDDTRSRERERMVSQASLIPDARAALTEDPAIAFGGQKALAAAARRRQATRLAEEHRAERDLQPEGHTIGGLYGG